MTGEPHPQDHHCGNCKNIGCKEHGFYSQYPEECQHFSQKKGCASHSSSPAPVPDDMTRALTEAYHEGWADREKMGDLPKAEQGFKCRMRVKAEDDIRQRAAEAARREVLDEVVKMSMMIEQNETERWESCGRPKNDGYINGSHSGFGHALRELRHMIDMVKKADSVRSGEEVQR